MNEKNEQIWSVSDLNSAVREILENSLRPFWLAAEVGTLNIHRSGHVYLTLKDEHAQVKGIYFGGAAEAQKLDIQPGSQIEVFGSISVYEIRGEYQFSIKKMRLMGLGGLQKRFEELKAKLAEEGLFDEARKKTIPLLPRRIGVVSSPDGAAIRDFLQIINRRFPNINIKIYPSPVQGKGAEKQLARGIKFFNDSCPVDVIVITRGGGSMEDLWPFNEEILAREIASSRIPVISAVGHEIDFTICDFAADLRVPTPSAAAELVVSREDEFSELLKRLRKRMQGTLELKYQKLARRYEAAARTYVFREPIRLIREKQQMLDSLREDLANALEHRQEQISAKLENLRGRLNALNPLSVLKRGYAILSDPANGNPIIDPIIEEGRELKAYLAGGTLKLKAVHGEKMPFDEILKDFEKGRS